MVQCEMCGTDVADPNRIKVEGAELEVCDSCTEFGTELRTESSASSTSTKYSTGGDSQSGSSGGSGGGTTSSTASGATGDGGGGGREDMFEDIDTLAQDYDVLIRDAREGRDLSQEELADELNEKASVIRKLERGSILPSDEVQTKLERELDIDLAAGGGAGGDSEWDGGGEAGEYTLGDVVERND